MTTLCSLNNKHRTIATSASRMLSSKRCAAPMTSNMTPVAALGRRVAAPRRQQSAVMAQATALTVAAPKSTAVSVDVAEYRANGWLTPEEQTNLNKRCAPHMRVVHSAAWRLEAVGAREPGRRPCQLGLVAGWRSGFGRCLYNACDIMCVSTAFRCT
jgi:hypothetical protein